MRWCSVLILTCLALPLAAQERTPSHCIALSEAAPQVIPAAYTDPVAAETLRIRFVDHSMFLIQTAGGLSMMTDFNGWTGTADLVADVVMMNNAHSGHFTRAPDPAIAHVLQGWPTDGQPAAHYLDLGEVLVRNVTTDRLNGGMPIPDGNSVFVIEAAGLCIGHLGHLHHEPTPAQYAAIGRLDVVMVAVDNGLTTDLATVLRIMERFKARIVIPMHWEGRGTLEPFLAAMGATFDVTRVDGAEVTVARDTLPDRPTVVVLQPRLLRPGE